MRGGHIYILGPWIWQSLWVAEGTIFQAHFSYAIMRLGLNLDANSSYGQWFTSPGLVVAINVLVLAHRLCWRAQCWLLCAHCWLHLSRGDFSYPFFVEWPQYLQQIFKRLGCRVLGFCFPPKCKIAKKWMVDTCCTICYRWFGVLSIAAFYMQIANLKLMNWICSLTR